MKKRVVLQFDNRSFLTRQEFEDVAKDEGWPLIEIQTINGVVLIPDINSQSEYVFFNHPIHRQ